MIKNSNILVCLPTLNEVKSIVSCIAKVRALDWDLVITDGGSTDGTLEIALKNDIHVLSRPGKGKGYGFQMALKYANDLGYEFLAVVDCDGTYPIEAFEATSKFLIMPDMMLFCRVLSKIEWHRRLVNIVFIKVFNILFQSDIKDVATGMRILNVKKFYKQVKSNGFEVELELCAIAIKKKYSIEELKINYNKRLGIAKSSAFVALKVFTKIFFLRLRFLFDYK